MADWELLVPGIGLSVLGLAGVGISLAGVARTFLEGMHAVSALVLFIGLILFAAGILKDGIPRSGQAKAATLIIIGFMGTFGAFAVGLAEIPELVTLTGILFLILLPAVVIAWAAHNRSPYFKAITILFSSAAAVGIISFSIFGLVAPQPIEAGVLEEGEEGPENEQPPEITGPTAQVSIPEGAQIEGNLAYDPPELTVEKGTTIVWTNDDTVIHTVTSGTIEDPDFGELFDSGTMSVGETWALNTEDLELGTYGYFCTFHPYMLGNFTVIATGAAPGTEESAAEEPQEEQQQPTETGDGNVVNVNIVLGADDPNNAEFYVPKEVTVEPGTTVVWTNSDTIGHTVTSGSPGDPDAGEIFDSGFPLMKPEETFEYAFEETGEYPYFCLVHPWMVGKVIVE